MATTKPKGRAGAAKKKRPGNVTLGPVVTKKVRVPINAAAYAKKESEIAQLEVKVRKLRAKIKPDQVQIAEHKKAINELTEDIEDETEEREVAAREEFHWNTNEVRVLDPKTRKELGERRTMTAEERKRTRDFEDEDLSASASRGPAGPDDVDGSNGVTQMDDHDDPEERAEQ